MKNMRAAIEKEYKDHNERLEKHLQNQEIEVKEHIETLTDLKHGGMFN
jgi:hypothetical protein